MKLLVNFPNIQQLIGYSETKESDIAGATDILMVLEYHSGGSLHELINRMYEKQTRFEEREMLSLFSGICAAVQVLHHQQPPLAHRDLKVRI